MAVTPVNISRVTHNLRTEQIIQTLQRNQLDLFRSQARIATGRSFVSLSEDPIAATRALDLTQVLGRQNQFVQNLTHGDNALAAADDAITEVNSLLIEASNIASQNVGSLASADEREAEAELVAGIRQQLMLVGNRQFDGRYIFAGRDTTVAPFVDALGGIAYIGDTGDLQTRISEEFAAITNIPGNLLFGALSSRIASDADLTPALTADVRVEDVADALGGQLQLGTLAFNEVGGAGLFLVDISDAATIGDVVDRINEAAASAGASLTAALGTTGIEITPGSSSITISDTSAGAIASSLGILTNTPTNTTVVGSVQPRVTRLTPVAELAGGNALDLDSGLVITNGDTTATVDLSTAETVQDIINAINNAGVYVLARINPEGTGIDVLNQVSGTALSIGENGGTTAADLGIRTLNEATPLDGLNFGVGAGTVEGEPDLRITTSDGSTVDVNLDGATTVGDVIAIINQAAGDAGVNITASLAPVGNGIQLTDGTGGTNNFSVSPLNASTAAQDLGLIHSVPAGEDIIGDDVNPSRTEGILGALVELERALRLDDTPGIAAAAERIDRFAPEVNRVHGIVGARSSGMHAKLEQMTDAVQTTEIFLSEVRDLDFAEAASRLQASITQIQASMQTGSLLLNLSLMDFLR